VSLKMTSMPDVPIVSTKRQPAAGSPIGPARNTEIRAFGLVLDRLDPSLHPSSGRLYLRVRDTLLCIVSNLRTVAPTIHPLSGRAPAHGSARQREPDMRGTRAGRFDCSRSRGQCASSRRCETKLRSPTDFRRSDRRWRRSGSSPLVSDDDSRAINAPRKCCCYSSGGGGSQRSPPGARSQSALQRHRAKRVGCRSRERTTSPRPLAHVGRSALALERIRDATTQEVRRYGMREGFAENSGARFVAPDRRDVLIVWQVL
jgi:hypothetical protein